MADALPGSPICVLFFSLRVVDDVEQAALHLQSLLFNWQLLESLRALLPLP